MPDGAAPGTRPRRPQKASGGQTRRPVIPPRLERDRALFERFENPRDRVDRDAVVERFLPLARQIAARYQRPGEPFDDVFQVACFGLVKAGRPLRPVPRDRVLELRGAGPARSAGALAVEPEDVLEAVQASNAYRASSLDSSRSADEDSGTIGDGLGVVEEGYRLAEHRVVLENLMHSLTLRERNVITLRFEHDLTQAEIGARLGVSQMQVSRILRQSLARLRTIAETRS